MEKMSDIKIQKTNEEIEGLFECHVTVENKSHDGQNKFVEICQQLKLKPVLIELPEGEFPLQLMSSSYHRGTFEVAKKGLLEEVEELKKQGFSISSNF